MGAYTIDQERKRRAVETRVRARFPDVELNIFNLPGHFRIVAYFPGLQLVADHAIKYNVFALVKMFSEHVERASEEALIRQARRYS